MSDSKTPSSKLWRYFQITLITFTLAWPIKMARALDTINFRGYLPNWAWLFLIFFTVTCFIILKWSQESLRKLTLAAGVFALLNILMIIAAPRPFKSIYWLIEHLIKDAFS